MDKNSNVVTFDFGAYEALIKTLGRNTKSEDTEISAKAVTGLGFIERLAKKISDYVVTVDNTENSIRVAYARLEGEDLREAVMAADRSRRNAHESAIAATSALNRLAENNGVAPLFTGDIEDRLSVADFCLDFTTRLFVERKK